jgi:hypothetical protein
MNTHRRPTDFGNAKSKSRSCIALFLQDIQKTAVKNQFKRTGGDYEI